MVSGWGAVVLMIYCVYRVLYGEDFIQYSIRSILPYVDKVFIFWDDIPWGNVSSCKYKGKLISFPFKFDNVLELIKDLMIHEPKIVLQHDHRFNNVNQFTLLVNERILPYYEKPDELLVIEVDQVFRKDEIEKAFTEFRECGLQCAKTRQVEVWRGFDYRAPEREYRTGAVLWNLRDLDEMPPTGRQAEGMGIEILEAEVHNFGFAVSPKVMYWKHLTALAFSQVIDDCLPNESWLEDKWLSWDPVTNNVDLEISLGYEHVIPEVAPYDVNLLPKEILRDLELLRERTSGSSV